ncbi:MAG: hypothetical protein AB9846_10975 [Tenuifilaceae bacterium]
MVEEKNNFLSALSVKDISAIFFKIDEQILELHNCSSDDFLGLNSDFKKYYKQSKSISENANEIFKTLAEGGSGNLFKELQLLYKELKNSQDNFVNQLDSSLIKIKSILSSLDQLFLPIKNLNQDLMTLKFLITNIRLSNSNPVEKSTKNNDKTFTELIQIINEFKKCSLENEANISKLHSEVTKNIIIVESILKRAQNDLDSILNNIHYGIILFAEKFEETNRQIPELTQKTERSSQSIADIITNLQYHDIIRQKIEHIQLTHKSILGELERFGETIDRSDVDNQAKLFLKIRDIAGLQAAILVKANKEYQVAIEKITEEFIVIGNDMTGVSMLCQKISKTSDSSDEIHLNNMLQKLQDSAIILNNFIDAGKEYSVIVKKISVLVKDTLNGIDTNCAINKKLINTSTPILKGFSENKNETLISKDIDDQFVNVNQDIQKLEGDIVASFKNVIMSEEALSLEINLFNKEIANQRNFEQTAESLNSIMNKFKEKSDRIQFLLEENLNQSKSITSGVKESIKKIRYYDLFETNIVDIILELNSIYKKIKGDIRDDSEKEENLKKVKELYTMESEHQIHDKVVVTDEEVNLFSNSDIVNKEDKKSNEDDVELF